MKYWMLFSLVVFLPLVSAEINLSQNQTYVFNYTSVANVSSNESFFCAAHNESACFPRTFNFTMNPGESYSSAAGACTVSATCGPGVNDNATCVIDTTLNPGDNYSNTAGSCNIKLKVTGGTIVTTTNTTVPQRQSVSIRKEGDVIHLTVGDRKFDIPVTSNSFSYDQVIELECPAVPKFEETEDVDYLVKQCRSWVPMLDETISTLVVNTRTCSDSAKSHVDDLKASSEREKGLLSQIGANAAQLEAANTERDNAKNETDEVRLLLVEQTSRADTNKAIAWIFAVAFVMAAVVLVFLTMSTHVKGAGK